MTDAASLAKGQAIFEGPDNVCFSCHRPDLGGLVGPNLTDDHWLHGCSVGRRRDRHQDRLPAKGMLPYGVGKPLTDEQVLQVASYVLSKRGSAPAESEAGRPRARQGLPVIRAAADRRHARRGDHETFRNELASIAQRRPAALGLRAPARRAAATARARSVSVVPARVPAAGAVRHASTGSR